MWRIYFESLMHEENCFVTLTYSDAHLPAGQNLEPEHVRLWIMRIRSQIAPVKIRYFLVGEYGGDTLRPHYHIALFGVSGDTILQCRSGIRRMDELMFTEWGMCDKPGFDVGEVNELSCQYIAGYVIKKLGDLTDERLYGRTPEFARMSRRPGIGAGAIKVIAGTLLENAFGRKILEDGGDVPRVLKVGRRTIPLGRYLIQKLREACGYTEEEIKKLKELSYAENAQELSLMLQAAANDGEYPSAKKAHLEMMGQRILQTEKRAAIYSKKGKL